MKPNFKFALILTFFALIFMTSCQNEVVEETPQNQEETIVPDSPLANLMRSTSSNDGAVDNVMDSTDCFTINLPVTIIANGVTITIDSLEDLEVLEDIFNEFEDDEDILEFLFPIVIVLNDYEEIVIENQEELEAFIEECVEEEIDVIECVDFVYPISFSLYNSDFQIIDTVIVNSDEELYEFLESLEEDNPSGVVLASLNFPVTLQYADGTTIEVNNNQELEAAIIAAEEECDYYEDECEEGEIAEALTECFWRVLAYNGDDVFAGYEIYFDEDGTLVIKDGDNVLTNGGWNISESDQGPVLNIVDLSAFDGDLGGSWLIVECGDDELILVRESGGAVTEVLLVQDCEDDYGCSAQEVSYYLQECYWYAATNLFQNVAADPFYFGADGQLLIGYPNGQQLEGTWSTVLTDEGVFLVLDLPGEPYELISLEWKVVECSEYWMHLINGDNYLVLERECENNEFDCPDLQANYGDVCETPAGLVGYINENCECVTDEEFDCPDLQANYGDACETDTGDLGFINENCECEVENSNPFECFSDVELVVCDDDTIDGITEFTLELAFANCPTDEMEITFHESPADAEAGINAIPSNFTNTTNPQTIYARVTLAGTEQYEVFEVHLFVEDCSNPSGCTEEEVDAILMECHWIPVNVNGSNDFNSFGLYFNDGQELVIEGGGMTLTGNWITTGNPNDGVYVVISGFEGNFVMFNDEWLVVECGNEWMHLQSGDNNLIIERECN